MFNSLFDFIRDQYHTNGMIPLHAPIFLGREREFVVDTIESSFVSSVGAYVDRFESGIISYTGSPSAVATMNGTSALHLSLIMAGVCSGDLVITQALTFVATCNAIAYCGAEPVFIDVDRRTLGLSSHALDIWLQEFAVIDDDGICRTKLGARIVRACVPMHTFGHPVDLDSLVEICARWNLILVEDAAESLGSFYKNRHTGTIGSFGILSFNGNKIITTGGGGMILSSKQFGDRAKYLSTTAKCPHPYEYFHDEIGYNYRLPNLNAALGCAQLEQLEIFVSSKRTLAAYYYDFLKSSELKFVLEPENCRSNYWLNAVECSDKRQRDALLKEANSNGVMMRPIWTLMSHLPMYEKCLHGDLTSSEWLHDRIVNLPSSILPDIKK